ncbi:MAG TPA: hypothetical protein DD670_08680 [Planctomycetaceae bacterium]|nr:hypothetical protein [Planctomycetaceae bacterium]
MSRCGSNLLRWCVIAGFGGFGVWQLVGAGHFVIARWNGDWLDAFVRCVFPVALASLSFAVAVTCLRRQYGELLSIVGALGGLAVFLVLVSLPSLLGLHEFMWRQVDENRMLVFVALPVSLIFIFGPIYAAGAFLRFCECLWHRCSPKRHPE